MKVWTLKVNDWDDTNKEYKRRYTKILSSSVKARREAVQYVTLIKNCKGVKTDEHSKTFYSVTAKDMSAHCVITQVTVG